MVVENNMTGKKKIDDYGLSWKFIFENDAVACHKHVFFFYTEEARRQCTVPVSKMSVTYCTCLICLFSGFSVKYRLGMQIYFYVRN